MGTKIRAGGLCFMGKKQNVIFVFSFELGESRGGQGLQSCAEGTTAAMKG